MHGAAVNEYNCLSALDIKPSLDLGMQKTKNTDETPMAGSFKPRDVNDIHE